MVRVTFVLFLVGALVLSAVACGGQAESSPQKDRPTLTPGEVIGLVQGATKQVAWPGSLATCFVRLASEWDDASVAYQGNGKWLVTIPRYRDSITSKGEKWGVPVLDGQFQWEVYEGTQTVRTVDGEC